MTIGAQLYTVRQFTKTPEAIRETFRKIAEIGYREIQVSAFGSISHEQLKEYADESGLSVVLTHIPQERLLSDLDDVIYQHKLWGTKYVGIGSMPDKYRGSLAGVREFIKTFRPVAQRLESAGLHFEYHNHDFEFLKDGESRLFDVLAGEFPETGFILDTYWLQHAGCDAAETLSRLSGRVPCIHLKDMAWDVKPIMAPVGEGNMNFTAIYAAAEKAGTEHMLVEQDECRCDAFDALKISFCNLKKAGF
ncbi:MAG: sugar phosphate isomerase/epimerase [Eubacteriales bacterium]|nr:sugar phosphate isomerase/epimerase [Eubacteriales bacterium]MDD3881181.1 sugar phosphate isomerase/epimerase [Eubacteriales bacterium]MDD4511563.1 sugar phosphate isomerase/epimerase [Eubacteriales bacterium]